jgi:hypothetical protein
MICVNSNSFDTKLSRYVPSGYGIISPSTDRGDRYIYTGFHTSCTITSASFYSFSQAMQVQDPPYIGQATLPTHSTSSTSSWWNSGTFSISAVVLELIGTLNDQSIHKSPLLLATAAAFNQPLKYPTAVRLLSMKHIYFHSTTCYLKTIRIWNSIPLRRRPSPSHDSTTK